MIPNRCDSVEFLVHVQPRSAKNAVAGRYGDALKLKLTAPPVEGAANKAVIAFLAKELKVSKSELTIVSGHQARIKRIRWKPSDDSPTTERERLRDALAALFSNGK